MVFLGEVIFIYFWVGFLVDIVIIVVVGWLVVLNKL